MKTNFNKQPESKVRIRFQDCDPFNHLNNSRYIEYMMNAREDHLLTQYNFDIYKIAEETGLAWVAGQTQIAYISAAAVNALVSIETRLLHFDDKRLVLEAIMWNENKTTTKAMMWTTFVHYNLATKKSQTHSEAFRSFFQCIVHPLPHQILFEERIRQLKAMNNTQAL